MNIAVLGIDIGKSVFHVHGVDRRGHVVLRKRVNRDQIPRLIADLPPCIIGMESCGGSHYWARMFRSFGHEVRVVAPAFVKPYVKSNKNDEIDSEAITEAVMRPNMRFASTKTVEQQEMQSIHRVRSRLVGQRTALVNQIRGLLAEFGIVFAQGVHRLRREMPFVLEDATNGLSALSRELFFELHQELIFLDRRVEALESRIRLSFASSEACQRIGKVEGIGPMTATALVAAIGDATAFNNGRELAAWLGLVPKQHSTGGRPRLLGISKRGDRYVRMLLIHGARSVLYRAQSKTDKRSHWLNAVRARRGNNIASVALANKNARIAWALLARETNYRAAA